MLKRPKKKDILDLPTPGNPVAVASEGIYRESLYKCNIPGADSYQRVVNQSYKNRKETKSSY